MTKKICFLFLILFFFISIFAANSFAGDIERIHYPQYKGVAWDWCLYWAKDCGKPAADDFCRQRGYSHAVKYKWAYMKRTYVVRAGKVCKGKCGGFTYVDCAKRQRIRRNSRKKSYKECSYHFCPECANSITLLDQTTDKNCQRCIDRNKANINRCMQ